MIEKNTKRKDRKRLIEKHKETKRYRNSKRESERGRERGKEML